ncbi:hypothetical protein JB92DRAFT_2722479, partial [Gautieria morchelliformis]
ALDYLPAQASSVPAERIFSSSAETDTRRRNPISPHLMEQLQMLKFMIKKARLDFTASWKWEEKDIERENEWQDQGYSVCAHKPHSAFDQQLDILDKDGNAQETDGEPGKDLTDLELEEFVFEGCDEWGEES